MMACAALPALRSLRVSQCALSCWCEEFGDTMNRLIVTPRATLAFAGTVAARYCCSVSVYLSFCSVVVGRQICQPPLQNVSAMLQELHEARHVLWQVPAAVYQRRLRPRQPPVLC